MNGRYQRQALLRWIRQFDSQASELWHINAILATIPVDLVEMLQQSRDVAQITENKQVSFTLLPSQPSSSGSWNLDGIGTQWLWRRGYRGQGIVVASLDSGVDVDHPALRDSWRGGDNSWFDTFDESEQPTDTMGHGTQTMGILCGTEILGIPIGVAPRSAWISARIFRQNPSTDLGKIHRALQWLLDPDGDPNTPDQPDIVNNSWGLTDRPGEYGAEFEEDIALLNAAGMILVFAAGNSGPAPGSDLSPANYSDVLSVGAVDPAISVPSFSSRGPSSRDGSLFPLLAAPGREILTSDLTLGGIFTTSHTYATGTSYAAAHVSGAAAVLCSAFPCATPAEIRSALVQTAWDIGQEGPDYDSGYGLLDMDAAFRILLVSHATADLNGDGNVDAEDLRTMLEHWMQRETDTANPVGDISSDGVVNLCDFNEFARQYGGNSE
ncbi:MAG: S8 family serine peptidase [Sedimentisphaerales bacterium]|nr:S8 family serine peptidase [Sedimentisphaerales bacterium]